MRVAHLLHGIAALAATPVLHAGTALLCALCLTVGGTGWAAPRSRAQMRQAAAMALQWQRDGARSESNAQDELQELLTDRNLSLIGRPGGSFAVVTDDDLLPAVIGVSSEGFSADNPNFAWWLQAVSTAIDQVKRTGIRPVSVQPSAKRHPARVEPLLKTHWGQEAPYNNYCPMGKDGTRCMTGCVATSMAQVLYYHRQPEQGQGGTHTIYYPQGDVSGTPISVNYDETTFLWDDMLTDYDHGYTPAQADAVARLMVVCGVTSNMGYDVRANGGSGALTNIAHAGMNRYLGFSAKYAARGGTWTDRRWMDIIFTELAERRPVIYGGQGRQGGHSFVLHGYREDGMVYINWGWEGDADGYYDMSLLNPQSYSFAEDQEMIYNIKSFDYEPTATLITLTEAGQLAERLKGFTLTTEGIKVAGPLNSTDLRALRQFLGCDEQGVYTEAQPAHVDLSEAHIVAGGEAYLTEGTRTYTTTDDQLPYKAFYNCQSLQRMVLPRQLQAIGDGVWGNCTALWDVIDPQPEGRPFVIQDGCLYSSDHTVLMAALPVERIESDTLNVPETVEQLQPYAFAGYQELTHVSLPAALLEIGTGAFAGSTAIKGIRLHGKQLPRLGANAFAGMAATTTLYVWAGMKSTATRSSQWRDFGRIEEYGTTITATSTTRPYGQPNPIFGYTVAGQSVEGQPQLICEATPDSAPGTYAIRCLRGTVAGDDVEFIDGRLIVTEPMAISTTTGTMPDAPRIVFDLQGRRMGDAPLTPGLYIVNGNKLIVK